MKFLGAVLVIISTSYLGFMVAYQYIRRPRQLQQLKTGLQLLETEVSYGMTPLPQAFHQLAKKLEPPVAQFFDQAQTNLQSGQTAEQAWQAAVKEIKNKTVLQESDVQVLIELGYNLGQSNREDQLKHLELAQKKLANLHKKAVQVREDKVKLWRYLGVLGGLLLVILIF